MAKKSKGSGRAPSKAGAHERQSEAGESPSAKPTVTAVGVRTRGPRPTPKFVLRGSGNKFEFQLEAGGAQLLSSGRLPGRAEAESAIHFVRVNSLRDDRFQRTSSKSAFSFELVDGVGATLARGGSHGTAQERENAISIVKAFARSASVESSASK